jgi:hypothetical protein
MAVGLEFRTVLQLTRRDVPDDLRELLGRDGDPAAGVPRRRTVFWTTCSQTSSRMRSMSSSPRRVEIMPPLFDGLLNEEM